MGAPEATRPSAASTSIFMTGIGGKIVVLGGLLTGCAVSQSSFDETRSAAGIGLVSVRSQSGDFDYQGEGSELFAISGESWGTAFKEEKAAEQKAGNDLVIDTSTGALSLAASSRYSNAGIDLDVSGPQLMGMDISLDDGDADLSDVIGSSLVTADGIGLARVEGSVDAFARDGSIDAELYPAPGEVIRLEAVDGSVDLTLPYGGSYDLQVWGDPEFAMEIDDLGFHSSAADVAYFAGVSGRGDTQVTIFVTGGEVRVRGGW